MRITATLAAMLALGAAVPVTAMDLSDGLRGPVEGTPPPDWEPLANIPVSATMSADDHLDAMMDDESPTRTIDVTADRDMGFAVPGDDPFEPSATMTVQRAMMEANPPEPAKETIPILHATEEVRPTYHVPRASSSMSVLSDRGWDLNNPRGSTITLGSRWAQ